MSTRRANDIPPATDELLAAGQRRVGEGRLDLRGLKPAGSDDDEIERNVEEITQTYGAHAQIPPAKSRSAAPLRAVASPQTAAPPAGPTPTASFRVDLPGYLDDQLRMRSAQGGGTKHFLIIDALRIAGYTVHPEDLVPDGRKARSRRN